MIENIIVNFDELKPDIENQFDMSRILEIPESLPVGEEVTVLFDFRIYENQGNRSAKETESFIIWCLMRCCELMRKSCLYSLKIVCTSPQVTSLLPVWPLINTLIRDVELSVMS